MSLASRRITILYLDDCPNEHLLLRWAARTAAAPVKIQHFTNPELLKAYMAGRWPFADRRVHPAASLVLLDYDLGWTTSLGVLDWIRTGDEFKSIPVVMFTTTDDPQVIQRCYCGGATTFIQKPVGFDRLQSVLLAIAGCFQFRPAQFSSLEALPECQPPGHPRRQWPMSKRPGQKS